MDDIKHVNTNETHYEQPVSFVTFLGSLTDEKLNKYFEVAAKLVDPETEPTSKELELGVMFYTTIITGLECKTQNTVSLDEKGLWAISLFAFLGMERFRRNGLITNFSGFLYEGKPGCSATQKMYDVKDDAIQYMTPEQRKKFNK